MPEKTAAQKLWIREGYSVAVINPPANLVALLGGLPPGAVIREGDAEPVNLLLAFIADRLELELLLPAMKARLVKNGLLWIAYHKGTSKIKTDIHRDSINAYAAGLGWLGVAMVSIDDDWSALRLKLAE